MAELPIPKVVFASQSDRIISHQSTEDLARAINAELRIVQGGHLVNFEHADQVNQTLFHLIQSTEPKSPQA
jgi:predicted alpha/beta hydrolase family esterase